MRRTKIIATIGPASDDDRMLDTLIAAGTDIFRLNFSHGTAETQAATFNTQVLDAPGVKYQSYAGFSTPGQVDNDNALTMCGPTMTPGETQTLLVLAQPIVANDFDRIPNDAVVSIPNAMWGTFGDCIAADHLSEITAASETHDSPAFFKSIVSKL